MSLISLISKCVRKTTNYRTKACINRCFDVNMIEQTRASRSADVVLFCVGRVFLNKLYYIVAAN